MDIMGAAIIERLRDPAASAADCNFRRGEIDAVAGGGAASAGYFGLLRD